MDQSIYNLFNNIQWSNSQSLELPELRASLSFNEIQTSFSQAGWCLDTVPTLIIDAQPFNLSARWTWYRGNALLGFSHWCWDGVLGCWAFQEIVWWILDKVWNSLHIFLV